MKHLKKFNNLEIKVNHNWKPAPIEMAKEYVLDLTEEPETCGIIDTSEVYDFYSAMADYLESIGMDGYEYDMRILGDLYIQPDGKIHDKIEVFNTLDETTFYIDFEGFISQNDGNYFLVYDKLKINK